MAIMRDEDRKKIEEINSEIPTDCRLVFNIKKLERVYKLVKYDANQDELDDYKDRYNIDDIDPHFGTDL